MDTLRTPGPQIGIISIRMSSSKVKSSKETSIKSKSISTSNSLKSSVSSAQQNQKVYLLQTASNHWFQVLNKVNENVTKWSVWNCNCGDHLIKCNGTTITRTDLTRHSVIHPTI